MFGLSLGAWLRVGAVLGALGGLALSHIWAYRSGAQSERVSRLQADVDAYQKREGIDHEVDGMERYRVCIDLGGLPDDCEQLRRMEEAASAE